MIGLGVLSNRDFKLQVREVEQVKRLRTGSFLSSEENVAKTCVFPDMENS